MKISVGEVFNGIVKGVTFKGLGVVQHPDGQVFFCRGVWPGDEGLFQITSQDKYYGHAELKELTNASANRKKAECPHLGFQEGQCGGCPWMIATYESQLEEKQKLLKFHVEKAKLLNDPSKLKNIWASPKEFGYRNRAQLKTDGENIGYVSPGSKTLAPIKDCIILDEANRKTLANIQQTLPRDDWRPKGKFNSNFIEIDDHIDASQIRLNLRRSFQQGNHGQNQKMLEWLTAKIENVDSDESVLELFCGSGNFTKILKNKFPDILATEFSQEALEELKSQLPEVKTMLLNIYRSESWQKLKKEMKHPKVLFLDPPREGFQDLHLLLKKFPSIEDVFYVSCDFSTFVQDTKKTLDLGYEVLEIQPVDQFPQTPHIEVLAHLKLSNQRSRE